MITEIVFLDGASVQLGYDGVHNITHNDPGGAKETFHIFYVDGKCLTVSQFDRYTSVI